MLSSITPDSSGNTAVFDIVKRPWRGRRKGFRMMAKSGGRIFVWLTYTRGAQAEEKKRGAAWRDHKVNTSHELSSDQAGVSGRGAWAGGRAAPSD
jgi:hypothetical protein